MGCLHVAKIPFMYIISIIFVLSIPQWGAFIREAYDSTFPFHRERERGVRERERGSTSASWLHAALGLIPDDTDETESQSQTPEEGKTFQGHQYQEEDGITDETGLRKDLAYYDIVITVITAKAEEDYWERQAAMYEKTVEKFRPRHISAYVNLFACHDDPNPPKSRAISLINSTLRVILLPCDDTYEGLLDKTRAIRRWTLQNLRFTYYVKLDDDVVINFNRFFKRMHNFLYVEKLRKRFYAGMQMEESEINTNRRRRWSDKSYAKIMSKYPLYNQGYMYVISHDLVKWMVTIEDHAPEMRRTTGEDVFVGMMLSLTPNITYAPLTTTQLKFGHHRPKRWWCYSYVICHMRPTPSLEFRMKLWWQTHTKVRVEDWNEMLGYGECKDHESALAKAAEFSATLTCFKIFNRNMCDDPPQGYPRDWFHKFCRRYCSQCVGQCDDDEFSLGLESNGQIESCSIGKEQGYCNNDVGLAVPYKGWFRKKCPKSCGNCPELDWIRNEKAIIEAEAG